MKYECIQDLYLDKYDDAGFLIENKQAHIPKGSIWEEDKTSYKIIGGKDSVHLDRIWKSQKAKTHQWLEITREHLKAYFAPFDGHWYSVWWLTGEGAKYEKVVYAETPSKAKYKAFKILRDEEGVFSKHTNFKCFIKYFFDKCELKQKVEE